MSAYRPAEHPVSRDTRATDGDRERALGSLREAYAVGALTFSEFGNRIERVVRAQTVGELASATSDLPRARETGSPGRLRKAVAILRSRVVELRRGEQITAGPIAFLGVCTVDLRDAWIPPGPDHVAQLRTVSVFGSVRLVVPPGVRVAVEGGPIVSVTRAGDNRVADEAPTLRVSAFAIFGAVKVITA